ncbi:MAG: hypothetical protein H6Q05_2943 [Acidobacteria bacterium]|nr:hypothetical protein [Acidobacteriota bacterium]
MDFAKWVREGMTHPRVAIYLKVVAVFSLLGALSHLVSIMGIRGSWVDKPLQFLIGDPLLLLVDLVMAWGLWRTRGHSAGCTSEVNTSVRVDARPGLRPPGAGVHFSLHFLVQSPEAASPVGIPPNRRLGNLPDHSLKRVHFSGIATNQACDRK